MYRDRGAVGALLDEYEKAISELKALVSTVTTEELVTIADPHTEDKDCVSIQAILTHVVGAGYYYAIAIHHQQGAKLDFRPKVQKATVSEYLRDLEEMFAFNEALFDSYPNLKIETCQESEKILTRWGQRYDVEQLYEHAIVHILRHRRQIERFLIKLRINQL